MTDPDPAPGLSPEDHAIVDSYLRDPTAQLHRQRRISAQYAVGAGGFMAAAFWFDDARLAIPVYLVLVAWLVLRQRALERRTHALGRILSAYTAPRDNGGTAGRPPSP